MSAPKNGAWGLGLRQEERFHERMGTDGWRLAVSFQKRSIDVQVDRGQPVRSIG